MPTRSTPSADLAAFLRRARAEVSPGDAGVADTGRRRTPGLRREEVAHLASISQTYYTYLEQGRAKHPSETVIDALARALRLDAAQTAYVRALATAPEDPQFAHDVDQPNQELRDVLEAVGNCPAWIVNRSRQLLMVNQAASALLGEWTRQPHPNIARWLLLDPDAQAVFVDWEIWARTLLARLRAAAAGLRDERVRELVGQLQADSAWVRKYWNRHEVFAPPPAMRFRHNDDILTTRPAFLRPVASPTQELLVLRVLK